ncbi:unnamed protein product [Hymenolepis diminuta]|uniref:DUF4091 domain-containing protein n=1 Tax=Hymenolepis diminuta TaxID=6216 RepID=A0A158QEB4_HYMDI|nr:unnamed protein product [Hymenolepis diminuta]
MDEGCMNSSDRAKWIRSLHFNNKSFSLNIEVNDRPSNWIINYIFEILLRERYGYRNINFIYAPWDSSANAIGRLNCEKSKKDCSRPPPIHVNLEVWLRTGEQVSDYAPPHRVSSNGPLGPITRWGLYANEELWNHYSPLNRDPTLSSAGSFYESLAGSGGNGMLYYDRPSMLNAYHRLLSDDGITRMELRSEHLPTQSLWNITSNTISGPGDRLPVLLNWYPNALTVKSRLVRLGLPDCLAFSARVPENVTVSATCDFEVNELVKVSWARLAESAPLIKQLLDRFSIKQADYIDLLRRVS